MKKTIFTTAAGAAAFLLSGCYSPGERAVGGGVIGGLGGAGVGAAVSGGSTTGTLAGAAIGAASGAALGAATAPSYPPPPPPPPACAQWGWDNYGRQVCVEADPKGNDMSIEAVVFFLLLIDAVGANLMVYFGRDWYLQHFRTMSRWFPPAEGWAVYYLALVLWVGSLLYRAGALF